MSNSIARELVDPEIVINDSCGAIVSWDLDVLRDEEKLDYHPCENVSSEGHTWRDRYVEISFRVNPGFRVEAEYLLVRYVSYNNPSTITTPVVEQFQCSTVCADQYFGILQRSDYRLGYYCYDGSPEFHPELDTSSYEILGGPVTITTIPCFTGTDILSRQAGNILYDKGGKILTAG